MPGTKLSRSVCWTTMTRRQAGSSRASEARSAKGHHRQDEGIFCRDLLHAREQTETALGTGARALLLLPLLSRLQVLRFSSPGTRRRYIIIRHSPAPQPIPTCRCSAFATLRCRVLARTMSMAASQYGGDSLARGLRAPIACRMFTRPSCPTLQMHRRPSRPRSDRRRSAWRPAASGRPP